MDSQTTMAAVALLAGAAGLYALWSWQRGGDSAAAVPAAAPPTAHCELKPLEDREFDVFISHSQGTGQDQAGKLRILLEQLGLKVWYDMTAKNLTAEGMEDGVSNSRCVLIVLTDGIMSRPFCQLEMRWAKLYGCMLVGVAEEDARHGKVDFVVEKQRAPADLQYIFNDVEFLTFRRRDFEETGMIEQIAKRIGPRPFKPHPLQASSDLTVIASERQFAAEVSTFDCVVYLTGFGSKMQYKDVAAAIADAEAAVFDDTDGMQNFPGKWAIAFGGDSFDQRKPDVAHIAKHFQEKHRVTLLAISDVHVEKKWGGVDESVDAVYYYPTVRLPNGKIAWGGTVDGAPVGATAVVLEVVNRVTEVRMLSVGGGQIAVQETELAIAEGIKCAFVLVPAKFPEAGMAIDGSVNENPMGPTAELFHKGLGNLDRRRVWVDKKFTYGSAKNLRTNTNN